MENKCLKKKYGPKNSASMAKTCLAKIKEIIHEGNIRRIIIKKKDGDTVMEIPMNLGIVGALIAPQLAAIGAIAALVTETTVVVEKVEE